MEKANREIDSKKNIKDYLEIVIITYNRGMFLQNTLSALCESPFANCHISILNNASTDSTLEICNSYLKKIQNLTIITNKINIGLSANFLRAVEISNGKYTWALCDDDEYDFSSCDDIFDAIITEKADLIHVGAQTDVSWNFGGEINTPRKLFKNGYPFFRFTSFLPCNIFKTASFYPYIIAGYNNIINVYPHMPFLMSFFELDKNIYISKNRIVKAGMGRARYTVDDFNIWWFNTALLLKNKKEQIMMFKDTSPLKNSIKRKLSFPVIFLIKVLRRKFSIVNYYYLFGAIIFLYSVICMPFFCVYLIVRKILLNTKVD